MDIIRPQAITATVLTATNIVETGPAAYAGGTTYALGNQVSVFTGTTAALYESLQNANTGNTPASSPTWWKSIGTTYSAWSASTLYALADLVIDATTHKVYESLSGGTAGTATMSIASPCVVTKTAHGLVAGTPITFTTTGALPTGLAVGTIYYVLAPATDTFNVAATVGGAAINTSGTQSGVHTVTANPNLNKALATQLTFWLEIGPTNKWAMFDDVNGTVTVHPATIDVTMALAGRVDSIVLLNIDAATVQVIVTASGAGTIYDQTFSMISTSGITDWYGYFFEEIVHKTDLLVPDLPLYADPTIRVIIADTTAAVQCGSLVAGMSKSIGNTLYGASVGIIDYSRKTTDAFGNYQITERAFSKKGSFRASLQNSSIDETQRILAQYRATPIVYSGADDYSSTLLFGFFRDFNIEIAYPEVSICSIEVEGLTQ